MGRKVAKADILIARIASRQHGLISVWQLYELGIGERAVRGRVDAGRLHRIHRGVYAVGHPAQSLERRWLAAVMAIGWNRVEKGGSVLGYWGAAVSHRSAASLWRLLPDKDGPVDVIVAGDSGRARRAGIRVHRSLSLLATEVTLSRGIPVTNAARTIRDLREAILSRPGSMPSRELRRAIRQANVLGLPVDEKSRKDHTRSDLESDFLELCRRHQLPPPEVNVRVGAYLADFLWSKRRLIVETDFYLYHRGRVAFQEDRGRDLELRRLGYTVVRLSEKQVDEEADLVAEILVTALSEGPGTDRDSRSV